MPADLAMTSLGLDVVINLGFAICSLDRVDKVKSAVYEAYLSRTFSWCIDFHFLVGEVGFPVIASELDVYVISSEAIFYIPRSFLRLVNLGSCMVLPGEKSYMGSSITSGFLWANTHHNLGDP